MDAVTIRVVGQDIAGLTRDSLRRAFALVLQETWLFEGAVHDNIAYGKPDATREEVSRQRSARMRTVSFVSCRMAMTR